MEGFAAAGIDLDCGVMGLGWDGAFWDGVVAFGGGETLGGIAVAGGGGAGWGVAGGLGWAEGLGALEAFRLRFMLGRESGGEGGLACGCAELGWQSGRQRVRRAT